MRKTSLILAGLLFFSFLFFINGAFATNECKVNSDCPVGLSCFGGSICTNMNVGVGGQCGQFIPAYCASGLTCVSDNIDGYGTCQLTSSQVAKAPIGLIDPISTGTVNGWACDPDWQLSGQAISVHIYIDQPAGPGQVPVAGVISNQHSENAVAAVCGSYQNNQRFSWNIPNQYYDGIQHKVYAYAIGKDSSGKDDALNTIALQSPQTFKLGTLSQTPTLSANYCADPSTYSVDYSIYNYGSDNTCNGAGQFDSGTKSFDCLYGMNCAEPFFTALTTSKDNREVYGGTGCLFIPSPINSYAKAYSRSPINDNGIYCASGSTCQNNVCVSLVIITPTCSSFTYSSYGSCSNGVQTRTVSSSSPSGCTGGSQVTSQFCTGSVGNTCNQNTQCSSGLVCTSGACANPVIMSNTCSSFTYSSYGSCSNGVQTRTVSSSSPSGCTGGNPLTSQSCTGSVGNSCSSDPQCSTGLVCSSGVCSNPPVNICSSFVYSSFTTCVAGTQTRSVTSSSPSGCTGGNPLTSQSCTDTTPPGVITGLTVIASNTSALVSWANPIDADLARVMIYLNGLNTVNFTGGLGSTSYTLTGLTSNTSYTLSIRTVDSSGNINSTLVSVNFVTTINGSSSSSTDTVAPGVVTGITVLSSGPDFIIWNWTNPTDPDLSKVIIFVNGANVINTSASSFSELGLAGNNVYTISIFPVDTSGNINTTSATYVFVTPSVINSTNQNSGGSSSSSSTNRRATIVETNPNKNKNSLSTGVYTGDSGAINLTPTNGQSNGNIAFYLVLTMTALIIITLILLLVYYFREQ